MARATTDRLPDYDPLLRSFHRAFRRELRRAVNALPVAPGDRVLDVPCGDGFYARLLADRLGPGGSLVAADLSDAYLNRARARFVRRPADCFAEFTKADAYHLPFGDGSFDVAWCAQSLISLDDPVRALAEMRRVVRPGGTVAVLESDEFHHVLLPWPVDVELAVQKALHAASRREYGRGSKLAPARRLRRWLRDAGLRPVRRRTFAADRQAPFDPAVRDFLERHLRHLHQMTAAATGPDVARHTDPNSDVSPLRRPDAEMTCLNTVFLARR